MFGYPLRSALAKKCARVTRDVTICDKKSTFGYFDGTNPITGKGTSCGLLPRLWLLTKRQVKSHEDERTAPGCWHPRTRPARQLPWGV